MGNKACKSQKKELNLPTIPELAQQRQQSNVSATHTLSTSSIQSGHRKFYKMRRSSLQMPKLTLQAKEISNTYQSSYNLHRSFQILDPSSLETPTINPPITTQMSTDKEIKIAQTPFQISQNLPSHFKPYADCIHQCYWFWKVKFVHNWFCLYVCVCVCVFGVCVCVCFLLYIQ